MTLDPRDAADRALIEDFLELSNKRSDRYPALHKALDEGVPPSADAGDLRFVDLGGTEAGRATARAWHGSAGPAMLSGTAALVLDSESGEPLAFGSATRVGEGFTPAATEHGSAQAVGSEVTGLAFQHSQPSPDEPPSFSVAMARRAGVGASAGFVPNVEAPVIGIKGHTLIRIAVGRAKGTQNCTDADYCYYDEKNPRNPNLLVPFKGSATLPGAISGVSPSAPHTINGLSLSTQVYAQSAYRPHVGSASLTRSVIVPDPTQQPATLAWNYEYDQKEQEETRSLRYEGVSPTNIGWDVKGYFFFEFSVPIEGLEFPYVFTVCSEDYPGPATPNCTKIKDMEFFWHCLAGGTEVTLADGTKLPIERVDNTMRVRTGIGDGTLAVEATTRAPHSDDRGSGSAICELATAARRKLRLTDTHPVLTPNGPVMAGDLAVGATVMTEDGPEALDAITRVSAAETFFNLKLIDREDRADGLAAAYGSFIANGVVVGDTVALANQYRATRLDADYMLARLPDAYHHDYASAIEDTVASS